MFRRRERRGLRGRREAGWVGDVTNGADADFWCFAHIVLVIASKYGGCRLNHSEWYCARKLEEYWNR